MLFEGYLAKYQPLPAENIVHQFSIKAIRYPGNEMHIMNYVDAEDFSGNLKEVFEKLMFLLFEIFIKFKLNEV